MVDTELKIKVNADTASIGGIKGVERAIQKVNAETEKANRLAGLLAQEYKLSDKEAAQVAAELKRVQAETSKAKQEAQGLSGVFQGIAQGIGQQLTQVAVQGFQAAIASVANTLRQAITEFEAFETALTEFDAKSDASAEQIGRIGEQAKELAAITSQTPASVAALSTALLTLGATASDVETNLAGITKLSDVLGEDPVLTGRVVQTGINNFEELGESADSITDKLNTLINTTAAGSAQGIEEFFQFFQDVGPLAGTLDADFDQLAAGFSTLRDGGFSAATAATGLRISLLRLSAPSGEAEELLGGLAAKIDGVDNLAFNADGSFRGFEETIRNFAAATQDLNNQEQLELAKKIFGDEGAPAILALLGQVDGKYAQTLENLSNSAGAVDESLEIINQSLERQAELLEGQISAALTEFGQALAPIKLAVVEFSRDLLEATTDASEGFDALNQAGERLGSVLEENPEIAERLGQAIASVLDTATNQLAGLVDAFADFLSNDANINQFAQNIERIGTAITVVGETVQFLFDLITAFNQIKDAAEGIPVFGERFAAAMQGPIGPVLNLIDQIGALIKFIDQVRETAADIFGPAIDQITGFIDSIQELRAQALQALGVLGQFPEVVETGGVAGTINELARAYQGLRNVVSSSTAATSNDLEDSTRSQENSLEERLRLLRLEELAEQERLANQDASQEERLASEQSFLDRRLRLNQERLSELQALADAGTISADDQEELLQLEENIAKQRVDVAESTSQARIEAAQAAAKAEADSLQEQRRAAAEAAERAFDDSALQRERAEEARARQDEARFDEEQAAFKKQTEEQVAKLREDSEAKIAAQQRRDAEDVAQLQRRLDQERQNEERAFQEEIAAIRDRGNREFSALNQEVERRIALDQAANAEEERALEERFAAEDEQLRRRREIEQEVLNNSGSVLAEADRNGQLELSPLEQARQDFEDGLQAQQEAFQEAQQQKRIADEEQLQQLKEAQELRLNDLREQSAQRIADLEEERQQIAEDAQRAFEDEQRALEEAFADAERDREREFKDEQRRLDRQNAERVAAILESARSDSSAQSLRSGGVAEGGLVQVHKDEFLVPPRGTRVVSQQQSRALVREALSARDAANLMAPMGSFTAGVAAPVAMSTARLERQMQTLIDEVRSNRSAKLPPAYYTLQTQQPQQDVVGLEMERMAQMVRRSGL